MLKSKLRSVFNSVAHEFVEYFPVDVLVIGAIAGLSAALGAGSFQEIVSGMAAGAAAYRVVEGIYKGLTNIDTAQETKMIYRNWNEITAKNESHLLALSLLLQTAFNKPVRVLAQKPDNLTLETESMERRQREALERVGYAVRNLKMYLPLRH